MQTGNVTTPFGRRPISLALVKGQMDAADIKDGKTVDKWRVFRDICEARAKLGVSDRALAVLNALLTFYPEKDLAAEHGLVVFPSNAQLSVRAHGITGTTLRRHLAILVEAGLIIRKDSPNGKRYSRKDGDGAVEDAFGFSLATLLARSEEFAQMAQAVAAERRQARLIRERFTICRRDIRKLLSAAVEEGATGNWAALEAHYVGLLVGLPRAPGMADFVSVLDELEMLREEIVNQLDVQLNPDKTDGNDDQNGRHIQNSNTESSYEVEPVSKEDRGENPTNPSSAMQAAGAKAEAPNGEAEVKDRYGSGRGPAKSASREPVNSIAAFPLGLVLKACPDIAMYSPGGVVTSWRDLMGAAVVVRSMLGVSPSAYQEACEILGPEQAATVIACILERAGHINSAGGYLRNLTRRAKQGEFALGPMLMALMRANGRDVRMTG